MILQLDTIVVNPNRRRLDPDKVASLAESIRQVGQLQPLVVQAVSRVLIAGAHRLAALKTLGRTEAEVMFVQLDDLHAELAEIDENLMRAELTVLERAEQLARRKTLYEALHPETKAGTAGAKGRWDATADSAVASFATDTAAKTGGSPRTVREDIQIARKLDPEVKEAIRDTPLADSKTDLLQLARLKPDQQRAVARRLHEGAETTKEALRAERKEQRVHGLAEVCRQNRPLDGSIGLHAIIYADPPWQYEHCLTDRDRIDNQYPTLSLDAICALPVADVATSDALLWLWTTAPKLAEAMRVIEAWGFTYRTGMVWDKELMGCGRWTRVQHEHLLIAVRGEFPTPAQDLLPRSVYREARTEHSKKPVYYADLLDRLYPKLPKLELFARSTRPGWTVWGNQTAGSQVAAA